MNFALLWGLWGLLAVPVIIGIYFFRRRFKPRKVSALFLWHAPKIKTSGGRSVSTIESNILLFLEILLVILLALAAAAPGCRMSVNIHQITYILDDSASMGAEDSEEENSSAIKRGKEKIRKYLSENAPFSCNLVLTGPQPKLLATTLDNMKDVDEALKLWSGKKVLHNQVPSFRMARQISGDNSRIVFITDTAPPVDTSGKDIVPPGVDWFAIGNQVDNTGFVTAKRVQDIVTNKENIFLIVRNFGSSDITTGISCSTVENGVKNLLYSSEITLPTKKANKLTIELPKLIKGIVTINLDTEDSLKEDNSVMLCSERIPAVRVKTVFKNKDMAKIFDTVLSAMGNQVVRTDSRLQLFVTDKQENVKAVKKSNKDVWILLFNAEKDEEFKVFYGPYVLAKQHPLCKGLFLEGTRWAANPLRNLQAGYIPLISCKDNILLAASVDETPGEPRYFECSFLPRNSNLQKTPGWPVFVTNIIKMRKSLIPGAVERNYRAGEVFIGNYFKAQKIEITARNEKSEKKTFPGGSCDFSSPTSGLYDISLNGKSDGSIAFNFLSSEESDLSSRITKSWVTDKVKKEIEKPSWRDQSWIFLLIAVVVTIIHLFMVFRKEHAV